MSNPRFADASSIRRNAVPFVVEASYSIVQPGPSMTIVTRTSDDGSGDPGTTAPTAAKTAAIDASQAATKTAAFVCSRIGWPLPLATAPTRDHEEHYGDCGGR